MIDPWCDATVVLRPQWPDTKFSVTVEAESIRLYVMDTDQEIVFDDAEGLMAWLRENCAEALLEPRTPGTKNSRLRRFTKWS